MAGRDERWPRVFTAVVTSLHDADRGTRRPNTHPLGQVVIVWLVRA